MPRIAYEEPKKFHHSTLLLIQRAEQITRDYARRGFGLTLRQLHYQLVTENFYPNTLKSYNKLKRVVSEARMQGLIDWSYLVDRGRNAYGVHWLNHEPDEDSEIVRAAQDGSSLDLWSDQPRRVEVWVEKQALEEVAQRAAGRFRTGYIACKGYMSQSEMWIAGQRLYDTFEAGQQPLILHLGDHDPSGIDMTRDIQERLSVFAEQPVEVKRIALNMDQIDEYNPPPQFAKETDSRYVEYEEIYGSESWELDSISPELLVQLIVDEIESVLDRPAFDAQVAKENHHRRLFDEVADRWDEVVDTLEIGDWDERNDEQ